MNWDPEDRYWEPWLKHLPIPRKPWAKVVESTKHGNARYKRGLPQSLEMGCVERGVELPRVHPTKRRYYLEFAFIVGASKGKETKLVYAEWHIKGPVHGRPITWDELQKKGAHREANRSDISGTQT